MRETRRRGAVLTIAAVALALFTGYLFFNYIQNLEAEIGNLQPVVTFTRDVPARTLITTDMLTTTEIPQRFVHDSYVLSTADVVSNSITIVDVQASQILQRNMLDPQAGLQPLDRAVSIPVDRETSVGGSVRAGSRVDIIVSYDTPTGENQTEVLLQDVEVLAVNSLLANPVEGENVLPSRFLPDGQYIKDSTVTVGLSLENAQRLTYMLNFAREVRLVIRRQDEQGDQQLNPVTIETFQ